MGCIDQQLPKSRKLLQQPKHACSQWFACFVLGFVPALAWISGAQAGPKDGRVRGGEGTITQNGNTTTSPTSDSYL